MNETKPNISFYEVSKNLDDKSKQLLKIKNLTLTLADAFIEVDSHCSSTSFVCRVAAEKIIVCSNGCLNTSIMITNNNDLKLMLKSYKANILNPLHDAMSILAVILESTEYNRAHLENNEKVNNDDKSYYLAIVNSNISTTDTLWDILNEQILESLSEDFNKMEKYLNEEIEVETN